jgi:hypothetical protein
MTNALLRVPKRHSTPVRWFHRDYDAAHVAGSKTTSPIFATTPAVRPGRVEDIRLREQPLRGAWASDAQDILGVVEEIGAQGETPLCGQGEQK